VILNLLFSFSALSTGLGADVAIGDAGTNTITTTVGIPRIYQIYRSFTSPNASGYAPNASDFGFVFTSKFNLHPNPQRLTDAQGLSLIDELLTLDDVMKSNVLRDVIGISSIETDHGFCMQPMFRVIPGFVSRTHMLHGNDKITSGGGNDIIIGDDIRGFSPIDLSELAEVQNSRQELDNTIADLSVRLSTLGYDTEFYSRHSQNQTVEYNLTVGCDSITTSTDSSAFAVGDTLTVLGRSFLGGSLNGSFPIPLEQKITQLFQHIKDVQQVLIDLHYALYEVHFDLLNRSKTLSDFNGSQQPLHSLHLADDAFSSNGDDTVVGDSTTLFFQIDSLLPGFEFDTLSNTMKTDLAKALTNIANQREAALDIHVEVDLVPTTPFSSQEKSALPFEDVPFYLSIGNDWFDLFDNTVLAVGDFATFGIVYSVDGTLANANALGKYAESVQILRKFPSVQSFMPALSSMDNVDRFFYQRYDSTVLKEVTPQLHGDKFLALSSKNVMFGDTLTAVGFATVGGETTREKTFDFYDTFLNAEYAQFFGVDQITVPSNSSGRPIWVGQISNDMVNGVVETKGADDIVDSKVRGFFDTHSIAKQVTSDFKYSIPLSFESDVGSLRNVCYDAEDSYIPSHTLSIYINGTSTLSRSTTVSAAPIISTKPITLAPTATPLSSNPTSNPTRRPTAEPSTRTPTTKPSSSNPTSNPTRSPTGIPSTRTPTTKPSSSNPTSTPTRRPTGMPSTRTPTAKPSSSNPTSNPTRRPTGMPSTRRPTAKPSSSNPTSTPTRRPTGIPSTRTPTAKPNPT
jgi:hypothetical protein